MEVFNSLSWKIFGWKWQDFNLFQWLIYLSTDTSIVIMFFTTAPTKPSAANSAVHIVAAPHFLPQCLTWWTFTYLHLCLKWHTFIQFVLEVDKILVFLTAGGKMTLAFARQTPLYPTNTFDFIDQLEILEFHNVFTTRAIINANIGLYQNGKNSSNIV